MPAIILVNCYYYLISHKQHFKSVFKLALTQNWLDNQWRHFNDEHVTKVTNPVQFIREKFHDRTPYMLFYAKITKPETVNAPLNVTITNEISMETTQSSPDEVDPLNDALIDSEMDDMETTIEGKFKFITISFN